MCGVAGIFNYGDEQRPVDRALLARMTGLLAHRGPDDEGFFVDGPVGLGHRRLAIVDLTEQGEQPMHTGDGRGVISFNGEIYNHHQFRGQLEGRGVQFRGTSDTEVLLHLVAEAGAPCLAQLAGIFALAYWDRRHRRLLLARDCMGVKQLYYYDDGRRLLFASEIKALLACPSLARDIDLEAVNQYLHFNTALFERTFFRAVRQVRAGECVQVTRHGVVSRPYGGLDGFAPRADAPAVQVQALREQLQGVLAEQLRADVPVGAFLSGGLDSSAIVATARRLGTRLQCFGVHFQHARVVDERPFQEAAARALGMPLQTITVDGSTLPDDLMRLMYFQDEPVIGTAMVPMYHLSRLAAQHVKVCLGGQGSDEIFAGYARYALAHPGRSLAAAALGRWRAHRAGQAAGDGRGDLLLQGRNLRNVRRLARSALRRRGLSRFFHNLVPVPSRLWRRLGADPGWVSQPRAWQIFHDTVAASPARDLADKLLHWDMQTYLTGLFHQDDRMSMAHGLESRVPFADPRMVRFACHTPFDLKLRAGSTKWILRRAVEEDFTPGHFQRAKAGFDNPMPAWLKGPHRGFVHDMLLDGRARQRGIWRPEQVERLLLQTDHFNWFDVTWKLLSIELWARVFVDPAPHAAA